MKAIIRLAAASFLIFALTNCSVGFNSRWAKAASESRSRKTTDLSGAWEGTWKSHSNGHEGTLRAIVRPSAATSTKAVQSCIPTSSYDFEYKATWRQTLSAVFKSKHEAQWHGGSCVVTGEKDLGRLGGVFRFTGKATPSEFHADYTSKFDNGVFDMKRPK